MTDGQDWGQPPQYPQQGYGQQYSQDQPWQRQQYDSAAQQQWIPPRQQYSQQAQLWEQSTYDQQPGYGQPPWPPQQPGYQLGRPKRRKSWPAQHKVLTGLTAFAALTVFVGIASAVGGSPSKPAAKTATAPRPITSATASGLTLTGFGATLTQWKAAHRLDLSVPARDAYLPRVAGDADGSDTWQAVMVVGGRVNSYTLNLAPTSLRAAEARARRELPSDARVLWRHTFGGTCAQEQFQSASLAAVLGDGQVNVEFDNAVSSTVTPVTEELFSAYDAPTVAQAPHC
jgi:hypothetical protein